MTSLQNLGRVISADILIVGGGIGGLAAAISAKESCPEADVLVVEKNVSSWAGLANKGHGHLWFLAPEADAAAFLDFHVRHIGMFLEDQQLLSEFARESHETLERFDAWGARLCRDKNGSFFKEPIKPSLPWSMTVADLDMLLPVHRRAIRLGVRFIDKTAVVDLLKDGSAVTGAVGFSVLDGTCLLLTARATVLAAGGQSFRILSGWSSQRGDGIAAAYRAGAEMRSAEFGSSIEFVDSRSKRPVDGAEEALYDATGQLITPLGGRESESALGAQDAVAWYRATLAGNGPIVTHHDENPLMCEGAGVQRESGSTSGGGKFALGASGPLPCEAACERPGFDAYRERQARKARAVEGEGRVAEVLPGMASELSPVKVDHTMATTVPGLFAIGNTCYTGSAIVGAVPASPGRMHGSGLTGALWMGMRAGVSAVAFARSAPEPIADSDHAAVLKHRAFAPLDRAQGVTPLHLVDEVKATMSPIGYSVFRSRWRMEEALAKVLAAGEKVGSLVAGDPHHLAACNEARSMVLCAEMFYRSSLERKESRGWFVREDYPERDDRGWLKWIVLKDVHGAMTVSKEPVPIEDYPVRP